MTEINNLSSLLRNLSPATRVAPAAPASGGSPAHLVARVISIKGELALLRWAEGNFTALLNAPVEPGETLLLEFAGMQDQRRLYRIVDRLSAGPAGEPARQEEAVPQTIGFLPRASENHAPPPALLHCRPRQNRAGGAGTSETLMELYVETEHYGLVAVSFTQCGNRFGCHFYVESPEAGEALQREAQRLVGESGFDRKEDTLLNWSVRNLRREAAAVLRCGGYGVNVKA